MGGTLRNDQPGSTLARGLARDVLGGRGLDLRGRQRLGVRPYRGVGTNPEGPGDAELEWPTTDRSGDIFTEATELTVNVGRSFSSP